MSLEGRFPRRAREHAYRTGEKLDELVAHDRAALRDNFRNVVVEAPEERPACELHGWIPARRIAGQPLPNATLCPECERDRQEAQTRANSTRSVEVMPAPYREPTAREADAWRSYLSEHEQELILRGQVALVDPELEKAAILHMDVRAKAEIADAKLTPEEKFEKRRRSYARYWRKRLMPRREDLVFEIENERGELIASDEEDSWDRNADTRSWLERTLQELRAWKSFRSQPPPKPDEPEPGVLTVEAVGLDETDVSAN
jgi:hypothetical protein